MLNTRPSSYHHLFSDFCQLILNHKIGLLLLFILLLTGYSVRSPMTTESLLSQTDGSYLNGGHAEPVGELSHGAIVSQSFMPNRDGLHRVSLLLATYARQNRGQVTFTLRDEQEQVIYRERFAAQDVIDNHPRVFLFPAQMDSALRRYTIQLSADSLLGQGITIWADTSNRYSGLLRVNERELAGDLRLEWGYEPTAVLSWPKTLDGIKKHGLTFFFYALLWTLPGLAVLVWVREPEDEAWSVQQLWAAALVLSGALLVILPQYTYLLTIPLGGWAVWGILLLSGVSLAAAHQRGRSIGAIVPPDWLTVLYGLILLLVIASRFLALHSLAGPQWGDSLHHAMITQLLLDHSGIFESYNPYLPLAPLTYHAGFHLLSAWLSWSVWSTDVSSAIDGTTAIMLAAQWMNVVAVVMVGFLAEGLAQWRLPARKAQIAGLLALLIAGLLSQMPAFYVNWGRYTQLAGQIFLPAALLWSIKGWQSDQRWAWLSLTVLVVSALALTHYRVLIMYAVALPLLLLFAFWHTKHEWKQAIKAGLARAVISGVATCVLILPWYWKIIESQIGRYATRLATETGEPTSVITTYNALSDLTSYLSQWQLIFSFLALAWLLLRRRASGVLQGGWLLFFVVLSNPYTLLGLPGTELVNNFMLAIALYLPLATLIGVAAVDFIDWLPLPRHRITRIMGGVAGGLLLLIALYGTWQQIDQTDPRQFSMITHSDLKASQWVEENTDPEAIFHINGFFAFADSIVAGSDGGWWLWLTANREVTAPPMIYGHESGLDESYRGRVNARYRNLQEAYEENMEALAAAMRQENVDYVYIGAQQGRIDSFHPQRIQLNPTFFRQSIAFETVYSDGLTWIFKVREGE